MHGLRGGKKRSKKQQQLGTPAACSTTTSRRGWTSRHPQQAYNRIRRIMMWFIRHIHICLLWYVPCTTVLHTWLYYSMRARLGYMPLQCSSGECTHSCHARTCCSCIYDHKQTLSHLYLCRDGARASCFYPPQTDIICLRLHQARSTVWSVRRVAWRGELCILYTKNRLLWGGLSCLWVIASDEQWGGVLWGANHSDRQGSSN